MNGLKGFIKKKMFGKKKKGKFTKGADDPSTKQDESNNEEFKGKKGIAVGKKMKF